MRYTVAVAIIAPALAMTVASAAACSYPTTPLSNDRKDEINHRLLESLTELFEGEIIEEAADGWSLRVGKVYRGSMHEGTVLKGPATFNSCQKPIPRKGHCGIIWVGWGPLGPGFTNAFIDPVTIASLRRIGALPPE